LAAGRVTDGTTAVAKARAICASFRPLLLVVAERAFVEPHFRDHRRRVRPYVAADAIGVKREALGPEVV